MIRILPQRSLLRKGRRNDTLASKYSPARHFFFFFVNNTGDKRENKLSAAVAASPLYILHITTEGTMCLRWQVAIVHNVLMLTKCHFDPWRERSGRRAATPESLSKQSHVEAPLGMTGCEGGQGPPSS